MERRIGETLVSPTDETVPLAEEPALRPPRFDEKSIQRAQPAVPLGSGGRRTRSWPLTAVVLCVLGGVAGGVMGGLALTLFQRAPSDSAPRQDSGQYAGVSRDAGAVSQAAPQGAQPAAGGAVAQPPATQPEPAQPAAAVAVQPAGDAAAQEESASQEPAAGQEAAADAGTQGELRSALGGWLAATNSRDVGRQMTFYAPTVEAFYLARNASRDAVRAEKARLFARAEAVSVEAAPPDIRLSRDGRTAVMRFRKRYQISGGDGSRSGEVLQELRWRRTGGGWKIVGERDLRVLQ